MKRWRVILASILLALGATASSCDSPKCVQWGQHYEPGHYQPGHYVSGTCTGSGTSRRCSAGHTTSGHYYSGHYVSYCTAYEEKH